jgi:hypothetical protein
MREMWERIKARKAKTPKHKNPESHVLKFGFN